jgi:hypothetical protein
MSEARIKGQEVEVRIVRGGEELTTITDVRSFEMAAQLELLSEGYLGETTDRKDEIYRGYRGSMELHFENADILTLMRSVIDRARRKEPGLQINIRATLNFPGGGTSAILLRDCFFGEIPISFGSRGDYGSVSLSFEGSDYSLL